MIFQPVERLQGNNECAKIKNALLQEQSIVRVKHTIEQHTFRIEKQSEYKIEEQQNIDCIEQSGIGPDAIPYFEKQQKEDDERKAQL